MPRPHKTRAVRHEPQAVYFKPAGVPMSSLNEVSLGLDELEAMRLADVENLSHEEVGEMMKVSRATAGRILAKARQKVALALVHGMAIRLEGGAVATIEASTPAFGGRGPGMGRGGRRGRGRGRNQ